VPFSTAYLIELLNLLPFGVSLQIQTYQSSWRDI
jgi:hypothetical protein